MTREHRAIKGNQIIVREKISRTSKGNRVKIKINRDIDMSAKEYKRLHNEHDGSVPELDTKGLKIQYALKDGESSALFLPYTAYLIDSHTEIVDPLSFYRQNIEVGGEVSIVKKQDQKTGQLTKGTVKKILTSKSYHPRGIKVELASGEIGRVQFLDFFAFKTTLD